MIRLPSEVQNFLKLLLVNELGEVMAVAVQAAPEFITKKKPVTKQRRVVVTGMGVVTPLGHETDIFYNNLLEGASGISEIETFDCSQFPTVILLTDFSSLVAHSEIPLQHPTTYCFSE